MKQVSYLFATLVLAIGTNSYAATIVNLAEGAARYDSDVSGYGVVNPAGANDLNAGLTFNVTFTPAAGDLNSATAAVNLIEVGGDANGTGLYLIGGDVVFLSKMSGATNDVPSAFDDLNFADANDMIGVKSTFGGLTAGTTYSVAAIYDALGANRLQLTVFDGGSAAVDNYVLAGTGGGNINWRGDDTYTALIGVGPNGGGLNVVGGNPFSEAAVNGNPFEGTQGRALMWNDLGQLIELTTVPEPATATLGLLGLGGLLMRRRRAA